MLRVVSRHEMDRCEFDGWRRDHVLIDGILVARCPFCHSMEAVE